MANERTLILAKADAVVRGLVGDILSRFERRGYTIVGMKMLIVEPARARKHYAEHEGKPFFNGSGATSCTAAIRPKARPARSRFGSPMRSCTRARTPWWTCW
jgi:hypothetical protein